MSLIFMLLLTTPILHIEVPNKVVVAKPFKIKMTITRDPNEQIRNIGLGAIGRIKFNGDAKLKKIEKLDSGKIKQLYEITAISELSDHIISHRIERLNRKIKRYKSLNDESKRSKIETIQKKINELNKLYGFPSIPILYTDQHGNNKEIYTKAKPKDEFVVVQPFQSSTPQLKEPFSKNNLKSGGPRWRLFSEYQKNVYLIYGLYGALFALLLLGVGYWVRKKWLERKRFVPPPPRPYHEIAYEKLAKLGEMIPLKDKKSEEIFAFGLSETMREYFGKHFNFDALEMTVTEFMEEIQNHKTPGILKQDLYEFFDFLEFVKFAKIDLEDSKARDLLERAHLYIERTYTPTDEGLQDSGLVEGEVDNV